MEKAIVLLSGGLDSTTCLAVARAQGYECYGLSIDYQQRHRYELIAAARIAKYFDVKYHKILTVPLHELGNSALTDFSIAIPKFQERNSLQTTYVPARNAIFLTLALAWAETLQAESIFIGVSCIDFSGYPDCKPEFIRAFEVLANVATNTSHGSKHYKIQVPLINLSKAETIKLGLLHGVDYGLTVSCYDLDENGYACGFCDSCELRKKGFREAGVVDPTKYL